MKKHLILILVFILVNCTYENNQLISCASKYLEKRIIVPIPIRDFNGEMRRFYLIANADIYENIFVYDSINQIKHFSDFLFELQSGKISIEPYSYMFESFPIEENFLNSLKSSNNVNFEIKESYIVFSENLTSYQKHNLIFYLTYYKGYIVSFEEYSGYFYIVDSGAK
jgi:hypothetical protein